MKKTFRCSPFWVYDTTLDQFTLSGKASNIALIKSWILFSSWAISWDGLREILAICFLWQETGESAEGWEACWSLQYNCALEECPLAANLGPCEYGHRRPLLFPAPLNLVGFSGNRSRRVLQFKRSAAVQGAWILCGKRPGFIHKEHFIGRSKALERRRNRKEQQSKPHGPSLMCFYTHFLAFSICMSNLYSPGLEIRLECSP